MAAASATVATLVSLVSCHPFIIPGRSAPAGQAAGQVCLTGKLTYDHHDAEAGPDSVQRFTNSIARDANWELRGKTSASSKDQLLASGRTDQKYGTFKACFHQTGPLPELYMKFRSSSTNLWRVISPASRTEFVFESRHLIDVSTSRNLGTVRVPPDLQGAWKIVDTLGDLYRKVIAANTSGPSCWTRHQTAGHCDELTFTWSADATQGGYWDPQSRNAVLTTEDADSKHTILHEAGHWLQFELYDHSFPDASGCDDHAFNVANTKGCAWTEGFADAVAAYTLDDYRYVYPDGKSFDLHNDSNTPWDKGDAVQGRIGSSLLDLWARNGPDGGDWDKNLQLMTDHRSADFHEYFATDRPKVGLSTTGTAQRIISTHTIDY